MMLGGTLLNGMLLGGMLLNGMLLGGMLLNGMLLNGMLLGGGDTLIFVDFPRSSTGEHNKDCFGHEWSSVYFRASSHKLWAIRSSKFAGMLGANYQSRIQRERNLLNKLPQGIRFVLDLTPPSEGEELVSQRREVALTPGIIGWWTASDKHGVDGSVVFGHDDVCTCIEELANDDKEILEDVELEERNFWLGMRRPYDLSILSRIQHEVQSYVGRRFTEWKRRVNPTAGQVPAHREIPDYCPVRHRVGILRLLLLIEDRPVLIDSAPLAWTLVAVANTFDCAGVVHDVFRQWLRSSNNAVFVEALPEESLQLGFTLRLPDVTRSAFRILVNELALEQAAADTRDIHKIASYTVLGRKRHNPGDHLNKLIQHAAYAMFQRVSQFSRRLVRKTIFEDLRIPEWELLQSLSRVPERRHEEAAFRELEDVTQIFLANLNEITAPIVESALEKYPNDPNGLLARIDYYRNTCVDTPVFRPFLLVYEDFNIVQKSMFPFVSDTIYTKLNDKKIEFYRNFIEFHACWRQTINKYPDLRREVVKACLSAPEQFGIREFKKSVDVFLESFKRDFHPQDFDIPISLSRAPMLLPLTQNEFRFLPPWAGGNNDGTGAVFEDSRTDTPSMTSGFLLVSSVAAFGRRTRAVLAMTGLIERDVPPGHQRIRWKNIGYGGARYIDIRRHQDICELTKPCNCLPPTALVVPQGTEYRCSPIPAKFSPPVGPRLMMDYFTNPDDIPADSTLVLQQLPKRTCGRLLPQHTEIVEAWGIYYKEDWDWEKIWWLLGLAFFPPSMLFGILWGVLKHDLQSAFGIASWWMTGATIIVGIVGTKSWAH
ncbi:hypothetical protein QIS74_06293 [Colletotrichum tabaci]|uniref:Uncharacterized protein n=1 Tax=Colletotrichum tabaci TaxID=1209068 RepID=A0AAV9TCI9_9PEZI